MIFPMFFIRAGLVVGMFMFMVGQGMGPLWASSKGALHDDPPPPYQPPVVRPSAPPMPKKLDDEGERKAAVKEFVLQSDADQMRTLAAVRNMATPHPPIHIKVEKAATNDFVKFLTALVDIIKPTPPRVKSFDEKDAKIDYDFVPQLSFESHAFLDYRPSVMGGTGSHSMSHEVNELLDKGVCMTGLSLCTEGPLAPLIMDSIYLNRPYFKKILLHTSSSIDLYPALEKHLSQNKWLESLTLRSFAWDDKKIKAFAVALLSNKTLRILGLDVFHWDFSPVLAALEDHPTLDMLDVSGVSTKENLMALEEFMKRTSRLKDLKITLSYLSNQPAHQPCWIDVTPLGQAIAQNTTCQDFSLERGYCSYGVLKTYDQNIMATKVPGMAVFMEGLYKNRSIEMFNGEKLIRPFSPLPHHTAVLPASAPASSHLPPSYHAAVASPSAPPMPRGAARDDQEEKIDYGMEFMLKSNADQIRVLRAVMKLSAPYPPIHIKVGYAADLKNLIDFLHSLAKLINVNPGSFDSGLSFDPGPDVNLYHVYPRGIFFSDGSRSYSQQAEDSQLMVIGENEDLNRLLDAGIGMRTLYCKYSRDNPYLRDTLYMERSCFKKIVIHAGDGAHLPASISTHLERHLLTKESYEWGRYNQRLNRYEWLESLDVRLNPFDPTIKTLAFALLSNTALRTLTLRDVYQQDYSTMIAALELHPTLDTLEIYDMQNTQNLLAIKELVQKTLRLKTLRMSMIAPKWVDLTPLGQAILTNKTLTSLFLTPEDILTKDLPGMKSFIEGVNKNTSIVYFNGKDLNRPLELPAPPKPVVMPAPAAAPAPRPLVVAPAAPKASSQAANDGCCTIH